MNKQAFFELIKHFLANQSVTTLDGLTIGTFTEDAEEFKRLVASSGSRSGWVEYSVQFRLETSITGWDVTYHKSAEAQAAMVAKLTRWLEEFKELFAEEYAALAATVEAIKADTKPFDDGSKHFEVRASGRLVSNILHVESCVYIVPITGHQYQTLEAAQYSLISYYRAVSEENKQREAAIVESKTVNESVSAKVARVIRSNVTVALFGAALFGSAVMAPAAHASNESDANKYQAQIGESVYNVAVLTGQIEAGQSQATKREISNQLTDVIDNFVLQGLEAKSDCGTLEYLFREETLPAMKTSLAGDNPSPEIQKHVNKAGKAMDEYLISRCFSLGGK